MPKFNTGNPVGSSDPRDLFDNAAVADNLVNGNSAGYSDRLGASRKSWKGMELEFNNDQATRESTFTSFIASSGYQFSGDYDAGIEITQYNQVVRDSSGEFWRVSGSTSLPYTTTGSGLPESGAFTPIGDAVLRQELDSNSAGSGSDRISHTGTYESVTQALDKRTIYVRSVAELESIPADEGQQAIIQGLPLFYESGQWRLQLKSFLTERRITTQSSGGGALTPVTFNFEDGEIVSIFRAGATVHSIEEGAYPAIIRSTDYGQTWSEPEQVTQDPDYDLRNYGGGIAPNGDLILFYSRRADAGTDEAGYIISDDRGLTWGTPQVLTGIASVPTVHVVFAEFDGTLVQPMLGDTPDRAIWLARSTDNGQNWTTEELFTEADAEALYTGATVNGTFIIALNDTDGLIVTRPEGGEAIGKINVLAAYTTDGGATWSDLIETNSPMGSQPPTLHFDGEFIWHIWPNRKTVEENLRGVYTPVFRGASTQGSHTYVTQKGGYVLDGSVVHVWGQIQVDTWDAAASGDLEVTLPFDFSADLPDFPPVSGGSIRRISDIPNPASSSQILIGVADDGRGALRFPGAGDGDTGILADDITGSPSVQFHISYPRNSPRGIVKLESSYYAALLHKDSLSDPTKFRAPFALPVGIPKHGSEPNGDSGYANVIEIKGVPHMIYYKGAFNEDGSDLYIAPLVGAL